MHLLWKQRASPESTGNMRASLLRRVSRQIAVAALPRGARALCTPAVVSELPAVLERLKIEREAIPAGISDEVMVHRLGFLEAIGVPNVAAAVACDPQLLTHDPATVAAPRLEYLLSLGVSRVGPMVGMAPQLLSCDVTNDLHRKVAILQALGVTRVANFLQRNPWLVLIDIERDMRPPIEYLRSIENLNLGKVLDALPSGVFGGGKIDGLEKTKMLKARVEYLGGELGVAPQWRLGRMLSRHPQLLVSSVEDNLKPKVEWLKSIGVEDVALMLYKHPRILGLSLETLRQKYSFIVDEWGRPSKEVAIFPQCLTYSLDYLRARAGFLIANGKADQHHLHRILRTADYLFAKKLSGGRTAVEYQAFAHAIKGQVAADEATIVGVDGDAESDDDEAPTESAAGASRSLAEIAAGASEEVGRKKELSWETAGDKHMARRLAEMQSDAKQAEAVAEVRRTIDEFLGVGSTTVVVDGESASPQAEKGDVQEADVDKKWPKYMFRAT